MSDDVKQSLAELQDLVLCRCHDAYKIRRLHDPDCHCDVAESVKAIADRIEELDLSDRRYRWIRDGGWMLIGKDRGNGPEWPEAAEVDRLVDSAIAKANGEE